MVRQTLFTVSGHGEFPTDMLRHDCAWPADTPSALRIGRTFDPETKVEHRINLFVRGNREKVTVDRWRSFGWYVQIQTEYA